MTTRHPQSRRRAGHAHRLLHGRRGRRWAWTLAIGALLVVAGYTWAFYYFFVGPTGFRWRALYGDAKYPQGFDVHGIDISHYQGNIDWDELSAKAQICGRQPRFVIIKSTEGASRVDPKFEVNFYQAREYGFVRGAYHFWSVRSSARAQARFFLSRVHLEEGDLPPVLDIEHKPNGQSVQDFQTDVLTWLHMVENRYGVRPIIYTYHNFKEQYLSAPVFDDYPYWIAHYYVDRMKHPGPWTFWQHTDAGSLPGIGGYVDLNVFNGSEHDLQSLTISRHRRLP